jgi:uncharacterized membrane protein YkvA (DUF1232 family)
VAVSRTEISGGKPIFCGIKRNPYLEDHFMIANPHELQPAANENQFGEHFSQGSFWRKLRSYARVAGREVVEKALLLYYVLQSPQVPTWARTVVVGALGYFVLPADAVPDLLPGIGFVDDLGAMAAALGVVIAHITPEIRAQARRKMREWFKEEPVAAQDV